MNRTLFILLLLTSLRALPQQPTTWVDSTLSTMSLDEKIGQLFMIAAYSNKDTKYENELEKLIVNNHIGGLIFFQGDPIRQVTLTNRYQKISKYPLIIGMDAEHGVGWRLTGAMEFPLMLNVGAVTNDTLAYRLGAAIARHCKALGVHINFAPDIDINSNPNNPVIGMRSFGQDRDRVSNKGIAYMQGTLSQNVLPVAKHFPGHGDTDTDSHLALPVINHSRAHLDSVDLYPYRKMIAAGLPAIMVSHLNVPSLEKNAIPATLSRTIVTDLLRHDLQFDGIVFTDAMNMKGVTENREKGEPELLAFLAGSDILLFPADVEASIMKIKQAVELGTITEEQLNERCHKILTMKKKFIPRNSASLSNNRIWSFLVSPRDFALRQEIFRSSITLIKNNNDILPLKRIDTLKIASLNFGLRENNDFQLMLSHYTNVTHFFAEKNIDSCRQAQLIDSLAPYDCIIIYNRTAGNDSRIDFGNNPQLPTIIKALEGKRIILCHPATPYGLTPYIDLPIDAILINYSKEAFSLRYAAQAIFGGIPICGTLPVDVNSSYPAGTGIMTKKTRLGYATPEMCRMSTRCLNLIDSICRTALRSKMTPGCQVIVAKDGYIVYNTAIGYNTYDGKKSNHINNIYDIASVTKIAATLPAVMKLIDEGKMKLDAPLSDYLPELRNTNKKDITIREVLCHQAGLKATLPFIADAVKRDKVTKKGLFSRMSSEKHRVKLKNELYLDPDYSFLPQTFSHTSRKGYEKLTAGLYIYPPYSDTLKEKLFKSEINEKKKYLYSDLGFMLLKYAVEAVTEMPFDKYCRDTFYSRLSAINTDFNALQRLKMENVVPSCVDNIYRRTEIRGVVQDPAAAAFGGVAGHAGLFSSAEDLAKIMQLYLNGGTYGGERYFNASTLEAFTQRNSTESRRGLGFDKPESDPQKPSPCCPSAPLSSFGHTGFTGTMVWADPEAQLIYIFLSNRTYPDEFNNLLAEENIRTQIQTIIYDSINSFSPDE